MRILLLSLSSFILLLLSACNKELSLPAGSNTGKLVLLGELTANDTVYFRAGQGIPFSSAIPPEPPQGLQVSIKDAAGNKTILNSHEDAKALELYTLPFYAPLMLTPGSTYEVSAAHAQLGSVSATVVIPKPFAIQRLDTTLVVYNADSALQIDVEIADPDAISAYYIIEAARQPLTVTKHFMNNGMTYVLPYDQGLYDSLKNAGVMVSEWRDTMSTGNYHRALLYTTDRLSDNAVPGRLFKRVLLPGKSFSGNTHAIRVLVPRRDEYSSLSNAARLDFYVKSVAPDYYNFLKAYEQYDGGGGIGGSAAPTNLPGNVKGGLGMLGGVYRWQMSVVY